MGNNIMNLTYVTKDLGCITAYGYAVEKGYTGTEDEYAELLADYANVEVRAVLAAERALMYSEQALLAAESILNITVSSSELPEESSILVTKTVDPDTGVTNLDFGFPPIHSGSDLVIVKFTVNENMTQIINASHTVNEVIDLLKNDTYPIFLLQSEFSYGIKIDLLEFLAGISSEIENAPPSGIQLLNIYTLVDDAHIYLKRIFIVPETVGSNIWSIQTITSQIGNIDNTNF